MAIPRTKDSDDGMAFYAHLDRVDAPEPFLPDEDGGIRPAYHRRSSYILDGIRKKAFDGNRFEDPQALAMIRITTTQDNFRKLIKTSNDKEGGWYYVELMKAGTGSY